MIRLIQESEKEELIFLLERDKIVNYFILLGFYGGLCPFSHVYGLYTDELLRGVLAIRASGNAQLFIPKGHSAKELMEVLIRHSVKSVIVEKLSFQAVADEFKLQGYFQSAVMDLRPENFVPLKSGIAYPMKPCTPFDASRIKALYRGCFKGSLSETDIEKNLKNTTGRGILIDDDEGIRSVAQTIFEDDHSAILYGVATDPAARQKGYSKRILNTLISELVKENKQVSLMVENEIARNIYLSMGFVARTTIEKFICNET